LYQAYIITWEDKEDIQARRTPTKHALALINCIETHVALGRFKSIGNLRDVLCYHFEGQRQSGALGHLRPHLYE
jgi:hypothetical protein